MLDTVLYARDKWLEDESHGENKVQHYYDWFVHYHADFDLQLYSLITKLQF